jgi:hypothetical protein
MLDVHPPHAPTHTWRDFLLHIATIVIGLLIAIGLEQSVEALHRHHQRIDLTEQMRVEAEHNLPIIRESIARIGVQSKYIDSLLQALDSAKSTGDSVAATGVLPYGGSIIYVSPSRSTWISAQSAGRVDVLEPEQAKLYARLDYNAAEEIDSENTMYEKLKIFVGEAKRAHYDHLSTSVQHITAAHRDDLLFSAYELQQAYSTMLIRLGLLEGADEAITAGVRNLEDMYPYQNAAIAHLPLNPDMSAFYGTTSSLKYKDIPTSEPPPKH